MKILIDMNLTPDWVECFKESEIESIHWTNVGDIHAEDIEIFQWAKAEDYIILTQDLDFSTILALSNSDKPSVILIRGKSSLPDEIGIQLLNVITRYSKELEIGAHIVLDALTARVRILPLNVKNIELQ